MLRSWGPTSCRSITIGGNLTCRRHGAQSAACLSRNCDICIPQWRDRTREGVSFGRHKDQRPALCPRSQSPPMCPLTGTVKCSAARSGQRDRGVLDRVPPRPARPRPGRCPARRLRRPRWTRRSRGCGLAGRCVATLPGPLHAQRADQRPPRLMPTRSPSGSARSSPWAPRRRPHPARPRRRHPADLPPPSRRNAARGQSRPDRVRRFPRAHWRTIWSTDPLERLNQEG